MTPATTSSLRAAADALIPEGWLMIDGLVCGFGDRAIEPPRETLLLRRQEHGTRIVDAAADVGEPIGDAADGLRRIPEDADALVARRAGVIVGVRTADCVPILLVAPRVRWAAAVHAGWRGTLAGIVREAVAAARTAGVSPTELLAALGPSIGPCCYEVSNGLAEDFRRAGICSSTDRIPAPGSAGGSKPHEGSSKPHLDLRDANRIQLARSGISPDNIRLTGPCTRCARDRFHSFRAEPDSAGRQVSWIGWRS